MTHSSRYRWSALSLCLLALTVQARAGSPLDQYWQNYSKANDDYYRAVRSGGVDAAKAHQLHTQIVAPTVEKHHRAYESALDQALASKGLVSGTVDQSPAKAMKFKPVLGKSSGKPSDVQINGRDAVRGGVAPTSSYETVAPRVDDTSPVKYDTSGVEQTTTFSGAGDASSQKPESNAKRQPASRVKPAHKSSN